MGNPRIPVKQQKGHLTQEERHKRAFEESLIRFDRSQLERPPANLFNATAKKEWKRIVEELKQLEMIGNLSLQNVRGFCNAYALYEKATQDLKGQPLVVKTETGEKRNPLVDVQIYYAKEMREFAKLCGLTPDGLLKFAAEKAKSIEENITDEFGEI